MTAVARRCEQSAGGEGRKNIRKRVGGPRVLIPMSHSIPAPPEPVSPAQTPGALADRWRQFFSHHQKHLLLFFAAIRSIQHLRVAETCGSQCCDSRAANSCAAFAVCAVQSGCDSFFLVRNRKPCPAPLFTCIPLAAIGSVASPPVCRRVPALNMTRQSE